MCDGSLHANNVIIKNKVSLHYTHYTHTIHTHNRIEFNVNATLGQTTVKWPHDHLKVTNVITILILYESVYNLDQRDSILRISHINMCSFLKKVLIISHTPKKKKEQKCLCET